MHTYTNCIRFQPNISLRKKVVKGINYEHWAEALIISDIETFRHEWIFPFSNDLADCNRNFLNIEQRKVEEIHHNLNQEIRDKGLMSNYVSKTQTIKLVSAALRNNGYIECWSLKLSTPALTDSWAHWKHFLASFRTYRLADCHSREINPID